MHCFGARSVALLASLGCLAALSACTEGGLTPAQFEDAKALCEPRSNLVYATALPFNDVYADLRVRCSDGSTASRRISHSR